jgi:hypothetical protein
MGSTEGSTHGERWRVLKIAIKSLTTLVCEQARLLTTRPIMILKYSNPTPQVLFASRHLVVSHMIMHLAMLTRNTEGSIYPSGKMIRRDIWKDIQTT